MTARKLLCLQCMESSLMPPSPTCLPSQPGVASGTPPAHTKCQLWMHQVKMTILNTLLSRSEEYNKHGISQDMYSNSITWSREPLIEIAGGYWDPLPFRIQDTVSRGSLVVTSSFTWQCLIKSTSRFLTKISFNPRSTKATFNRTKTRLPVSRACMQQRCNILRDATTCCAENNANKFKH